MCRNTITLDTMDTFSLSETISSSPSAATPSAGSSAQPTYTTAGTIYKPSSSQPLQKPTRRGRFAKWSAGSIPSDLAFLPKSALVGLSLKAPAGRQVSALQQYTPLQQNYDRAVSPFGEQDHFLAQLSMETPRIRSGNAPKSLPAPMSEDAVQEKLGTDDEEPCSGSGSDADDEDDNDVKAALLMNMPVKSLQNLASYPNPNQKHAQKALQRGTRPRPTALGSSSRGSTTSTSPPALSPLNPPTGTSDATSYSSNLNQLGKHDLFVLRRAQRDAASKIEDTLGTKKGNPVPLVLTSTRASSTGSEVINSSNNLTTANGALLPLTAGPPGQRQYRPLTFEPTFKALAGISPPPASSPEEDEPQINVSQTLLQAGIEDLSITSDSFGTGVTGKAQSPSYPTAGAHDFDVLFQQFKLPPMIPYEDYRRLNGSMERLKVWDPYQSLSTARGWRDPSPEVRALYKTGTDRLTDEALADRNRKTEQWWYSGVNKVYNNTADTSLNWPKPPVPCGVGVIGDKRPQAPLSPSERVTVGEAIEIPVSEHSRSLLKMAMHALCETQRANNVAAESADTQTSCST